MTVDPHLEMGAVDVPDDARPQTRRNLVTEAVDGELLVLDPVHLELHLFDRVSTVIWPFLDGTVDVATLTDDLASSFGAPRDVVRDNLAVLVAQLEQLQLLDSSARPDPVPAEPREPGRGYLADPPSP